MQETANELVSCLSQLSGDQIEAITDCLRELTGEDNSSVEAANQYLTFWCDNQLFGIGIGQVIQIVQMMDITPLPDFPQYIKGVLSIRSEMVPVMDLRLRLGKEEVVYNERTCIVLIRIGNRSFGLIVDGVNDVETIAEQDICPPPQQLEYKRNYLTGLVQREQVILILDMNYILGEKEIGEILSVSESAKH